MEMALYDAEYGYYTTKTGIIGQKGDFITAPELSELFGHSIAKQIMAINAHYDNSVILEIGAGTGQLCLQILTYLEKQNALPQNYLILEVSAKLQAEQLRLLQAQAPHLLERVKWLYTWPHDQFVGVVLANEVLDAMPVHRFAINDGLVLESQITWDVVNQKLTEEFRPSKNQELCNYVNSLNLPANNYCSEVNLWMPGWLAGLKSCLEKGVVLLIDYGFPRREYYHEDRVMGTIMSHQLQQSATDFLASPGLQDITAHVDFTHVAEQAHELGFDILGYTPQAAFLIANGILEMLAQINDPIIYHREATNLKLLLQSHEMGEIFKVMALGKDFQHDLQGFALQDRRASL